MSDVPVKRTYDDRIYDFVCTDLLPAGSTVGSVVSVADDQGQFTYGVPAVNTAQITYEDGTIAAAGEVIQVKIGGGKIPANKMHEEVTVRVKFVTDANSGSQNLEATALINLSDTVAA